MSRLPDYTIEESSPVSREAEKKLKAIEACGGHDALAAIDTEHVYLNPDGGWYGHFAASLHLLPWFSAFWFRPMCFGLKLGPLSVRFYSRQYQHGADPNLVEQSGYAPRFSVRWRRWTTREKTLVEAL